MLLGASEEITHLLQLELGNGSHSFRSAGFSLRGHMVWQPREISTWVYDLESRL